MRTNKFKDFIFTNKLKVGIIAVVLMTTIGYAAVNTSLNVFGNIQLRRDSSLKVFFESLMLDGINIDNQINNDMESFTVKQSQLSALGESKIDYVVKNAMIDYDANVSISCAPEFYNDTSLNYDGEEHLIASGESNNGNVTATTIKPTMINIYDEIVKQSKGSDSLINYNSISSSSNGQGVYSTTNTDSGSPVYFYRGNISNNNVIFADYCWQIIRTTETGGVKLLYNGVPVGGQCNKPSGMGIDNINFNALSNDNAYAGYMYGTPNSTLENTHANVHDSILKQKIDLWYEKNIRNTAAADYLEDTVWCNDRSISSGSGTAKTETAYSFSSRVSSFTPTLKCARNEDKLTVSSGYLKYPIATLTADEVLYAGAGGPMNDDGTTTNNTTMFLNNSGTFWTMTPKEYTAQYGYVRGVSYFGTGNLSTIWNNVAVRTMGVRPAISLKSGTEAISGDGSFSSPYFINTDSQSGSSDTEYTCKLNISLVEPEEKLIGTEYCFGTECFNIAGYDGSNFKLLSKYNLLVGNNASASSANYGHQDPSALGDKASPAVGTVAFGSTNDYATSTAKTHVDNYVNWLNTTYNLGATGRLIENDELVEIGCQLGVSQGCGPTYNKHSDWITRTTFFTGTKQTGTTDRIYLVGGDGFFGASSVTNAGNRGVRPLIIVPKDKVNLTPTEVTMPDSWNDNGVFSEYYSQAFDKLQTLSLSEKIGQLLIVSYTPSSTSTADNAVTNYNVGGVLFFENAFTGKTIAQVQSMTNGLQAKAKIPLMLAVDEEGGRVVRISPNTNLVSDEVAQYPNLFFTNSSSKNAWKLGSTLYTESGNNFELVKQSVVVRNGVLKKLGLNINFAPVVDIATPPAYISDRSFGDDPELVSQYASEVVTAGKNTGVSHSLKHFPGYGNNADTHSSSAVDESSMEDLQNIHLKPFKSGIASGAETVMVTHNIVSALDKDLPASLSPAVHNLLFDDLGFTGLSITDDLAMEAVGNKYSQQYLKAFKAGNHILLTSTSFANAHDELLNAVSSGEITEDELNKRVFKVLAWKYYMGLLKN